MTVTAPPATPPRLPPPVPSRVRRLGSAAGGALLWVAILAFAVWAALTRTDQFVVGIATGSVLALGALGLTLIYGILKFGHFAHGDAMMLGAYIAFFMLTGTLVGAGTQDVQLPWSLDAVPGATQRMGRFSFGWGMLVALPLAVAALALLFLALDRLVYRPLRERRAGIVIFSIASLGIAIAIRSVVLMIWGPTPRFFTRGIRPTVELPFGTRIVVDQLFIVGAATVLAVLVALLLYRTRIGKAMRAMADNPELARVSGIDTGAVVRWTWIVAAVLVAVAGVLLALQAQLKPELGFTLLLPLFAATILGGIGSPVGALLGGLIIGVVEEVTVGLGFLSPGYKFAVAFLVLILVILLRPRGLLGAPRQ